MHGTKIKKNKCNTFGGNWHSNRIGRACACDGLTELKISLL